MTGEPLEIIRLDPAVVCRAAATVDAVSYPDRIIEVRAIPYGTATDRADDRGRTIRETIAPHAFAGEVTRPAKRPVYREHDYTRMVGRVVELVDTDNDLRATLKIVTGPAGDETLDWAADGMLDASLGYVAQPTQLRYSADRKSRTVLAGIVAHVGLVAEPAYPSANVLAVRSAPTVTGRPAVAGRSPTPNLDAIRAQRLAAAHHLPPLRQE